MNLRTLAREDFRNLCIHLYNIASRGSIPRTVFRLAVAVLWTAGPAWCWNEEGHRSVALVAERRLSPRAKVWVRSVLEGHPFTEVRDLAAAAVWPDQVRGQPQFHHGSWHYLNVPIFLDGVERPVAVTGDILMALNLNTRRLKDTETPAQEKAIALSWIAHLVGDLHQPLHAGNGFSDAFPDGDRGGGKFKVRFGSSSTDLHTYWDSAGGLFWKGANHARLDAIVDGWMVYQIPERARKIHDPRVWAQESHQLARAFAYQDLSPHQDLSADYQKRAADVSQAQLTLAGYRLAEYLERLAKSSQPLPR